jgi:hypothetical protein
MNTANNICLILFLMSGFVSDVAFILHAPALFHQLKL